MQGVGAFCELLRGLWDQGLSWNMHLNLAPKSLVFTEELLKLSLVWALRTDDKRELSLKADPTESGSANTENMHWEQIGTKP